MGHDAAPQRSVLNMMQGSSAPSKSRFKRPTLNLSGLRNSGYADDSPAQRMSSADGRVSFPSAITRQYDIGESLGSGSTGVVRKARRRHDNQQFALKSIATPDEEFMQIAVDEFTLMRSLSHPGVVHAEAMHVCGSSLYLVLELLDESLGDYVQRMDMLCEDVALGFFSQLLDATNYMHEKRIVHRDLKPENLLLCGATHLKVGDFNSAKQIGDGPGASAMLSARGTHLFSAPELFFGQLWNERVDIWACGLVLYFMVRGRLPFHCTEREAKRALAAGRLPSVAWDGMSALLRNLVEQCLAVDMRDRPPAMELLHHELFEMPNLAIRGTERCHTSQITGDSSSSPSKTAEKLKQLQRNKLVRAMPPLAAKLTQDEQGLVVRTNLHSFPLPSTSGMQSSISTTRTTSFDQESSALAPSSPDGSYPEHMFHTWAGPERCRKFS